MAILIIVIISIIFLNSTDDRSRLCSDRANIEHAFEIIIKPSWCRQTIILNTAHSEENQKGDVSAADVKKWDGGRLVWLFWRSEICLALLTWHSSSDDIRL